MALEPSIPIRYPTLGVCGLSCRLCPRYHSEAASRCQGCKTASRLGAACSLQTCALKRQKVEYCGDCPEAQSCPKWAAHREAGCRHDSFISYQKLEETIALIQRDGIGEWERQQRQKERLLRQLLAEYNEGRSRSYFCLAVTLLAPQEIEAAMEEERRKQPAATDVRMRAKAIRAILARVAGERQVVLALRR